MSRRENRRRHRASSRSFPGDFERIDEGQPFLVVVDYAHTDDAMRNLIATARELNPTGRIITLFGAGGERDRTKRPLMGEAAGSLSDLVVLTSDNPRSEDPLRIINDVVVGLQKVDAKYRIEPDRERALEIAMEEARPGDIVLLAGKGHENYQVLRDRTIEFDDREKARAILRRKGLRKRRASRQRARQQVHDTPESLRLRVKPSSLETRCGGQWFKWLKRWVSALPRARPPGPAGRRLD